MDKLCSIPDCENENFGQLEAQAAIYLYHRNPFGEIEKWPVCGAHYMIGITRPDIYENEHEAEAGRKEIEC